MNSNKVVGVLIVLIGFTGIFPALKGLYETHGVWGPFILPLVAVGAFFFYKSLYTKGGLPWLAPLFQNKVPPKRNPPSDME